jgi:hypothetical protein
MSDGLLQGEEIRGVADALMRATPDLPARWVDEEEIVRAVEFFDEARKRLALLRLMLDGRIVMRWDEELGDWRLWHVGAEAPAA